MTIAGSTLHQVRLALYELIGSVLPSGVAFGWDVPDSAARTDGPDGTRRSVWLHGASEIAVDTATMAGGWEETYTQIVVIQCLPATNSTTVVDADTAADELLTLIVNAVAADPRLAGPGPDLEGWSLTITYAGAEYRNGTADGGAGYAAGFDVKFTVEATRCS